MLDYTILLAVTALTVPSYLAAFWAPLGHGGLQIAVAFAVIAFVAFDNLTGVKVRPLRRRIAITIADLVLQAAVIVLGLALAFHPHHLTETVNLGTAPTWSDLAFAFPIARDRVHRPGGGREPRRRGDARRCIRCGGSSSPGRR